ncbi:NEL-type E3 ubiquitin ligase domain-containing protein [Pseudomonas mosselii]|uniref:NEL-type E3 ubiquitin ligase domain-containing protein n=1 Tax=Pseudomonas mosselii TaxID=78327 RepID=UPI002446E1A3|nr:NEL-type E3 ubiquitin ligase domain-containing protein [Pseudomonas mosselii]MDH1654914.1 NEL-type E3 ubiquitin ligase domain-containing protein [Pseudomonas mosselii]MDH1717633.1 NEL-type E3 ubiquitin ligase domain-containing protein [Pseudomonas mosselii]MDH1719956.1 NEL-type E3 ubiquitin ligase domain-containing protein [Pseudomonas mosselii]
MPEASFAQDSIDSLIASRLPAWLVRASPERIRAFHLALRRQQAASQSLGEVLRDIPELQAYAVPLLSRALSEVGVSAADVNASIVTVYHGSLQPSQFSSLPLQRALFTSIQSLLSAALHNYHDDETRPSSFRQGHLHDSKGKPLALSLEQFAALCRRLDLGAGYQALLKATLSPVDQPGDTPGQRRLRVASLFEESFRAHLEVAVHLARLKGELDERSYLQMMPFMSFSCVVPPLCAKVRARQLYLLGKCMRGIVTLEARPAPGAEIEAVIAWIPGDPQGAVSRHASWQALYDMIALRLHGEAYRRFFLRFVSERDRPVFFSLLASLLKDSKQNDTLQLDGRNIEIASPLFEHLRAQRIATLLDDAQVLAVATEQVDTTERRKRLLGYMAAGLDLVGMVSLFVPVLGEVMLAVSAVQLAEEVYEGYQDWQLGDRQGALDHLFGVAESMAVGALLATGGSAVSQAFKRVPLVDDLVPIRTASERVKLIEPRLQAYRTAVVDQPWGRRVSVGERTHLRTHESVYAVREAPELNAWRVVHPERDDAYAPLIEHNGTGGWRHELESPQQWQGAADLVRRLSSQLATATDATIDDLLLTTGLSEDKLRRLHVEGASAPARLLDALERHQAHEAHPMLSGDAFETRLRSNGLTLTPEEAMMKRDFPGLTLRGIREILSTATAQHLSELGRLGRVPLSFAERARWHLRDARLDRACAGLRQRQAVNGDTRRLAVRLIEQIAPWTDVRLEILENALDPEPSLQSSSRTTVPARRILATGRGYQLLDGPRATEAVASDSFLRALWLSMDPEQLARLSPADSGELQLADWLSHRANADRDQAASLIGMAPIANGVRLPLRLGDGRLGYPLSGRQVSGRQACRRGIHQIFPTLSDAQLESYILPLVEQRADLWEHYGVLQRQLTELRNCLSEWAGRWSNPLQAMRRRRVATAIRRCWRRKLVDLSGDYILVIEGEWINTLPELPSGLSFAHVRRLRLRNMDLREIGADFLGRFPNLIDLDLRNNRLMMVPEGIEHMAFLRRLDLSRNRITIDNSGERRLQALTRLRTLRLGYNPLLRPPSLGGLRCLRLLSLRGCNLERLPGSPRELPWRSLVDYRDNRLREVRAELQALGGNLRNLALQGNPLNEQSRVALRTVRPASAAHAEGPVGNRINHAAVLEGWLGNETGSTRARRSNLWHLLQNESGSADLFRFLADFMQTDEFGLCAWDYRDRVWHILEACEQQESLREFVFSEAGGVRTCEDRLLLILSQLEVAVQGHQVLLAEGGGDAERRLVELGRSLYRLDQVDRIASQHIQALHEADRQAMALLEGAAGGSQPSPIVDEIEARLFYRVRLARRLGLPDQPRRMHYPGAARVTVADVDNAEQQVLQAENPRAVSDSLVSRPFWEGYLEQRNVDEFAELAEPFHVRLDAEQALVDAGTISEEEYMQRANTLMSELQAAERQLRYTLTERACRRWL